MKQVKQIIKLYLLASFMLISGISFGQSNSTFIRVPDGRKIEASVLNQHIKRAMDSIGLPGLSIAIVNENDIVYHETFGVANIKTQQPVTKQTVFDGIKPTNRQLKNTHSFNYSCFFPFGH